MQLVALFNGDKNSLFAIKKAIEQGHEIKYLSSLYSKGINNHMYNTPNIGLTLMQSRCLNVQLVSKESTNETVRDLEILLNNLDADGLVCGTVSNKYQKENLEKACESLRLKMLIPLWGMNPEELLREILKSGFEIIITAVSGEGFDESWLGRKIDEKCIEELIALNKKYGISILGENEEYESLVLDCPLFSRKLEITDSEKIWKENIGMMNIRNAKLVNK